MPTYDYECRACGHTFEHFQRMSDGKLRKCPECGRLKLHRLAGTGSGVIFKGSGFYETDYKRPADKARRAADEKKSSDSSSKPAEPKKKSSEKKTGGGGDAS